MTHLVILLLTHDYVVSKVDIKILFFCVISPQRDFGRSRLSGHSLHITLFGDGSGQGMKLHDDCHLTKYSELGILFVSHESYSGSYTLTKVFD